MYFKKKILNLLLYFTQKINFSKILKTYNLLFIFSINYYFLHIFVIKNKLKFNIFLFILCEK